jgi:hypothetical protein
MDQIWRRYLENQAFVAMHAVVGLFALVVIVLWVREIRKIKVSAQPVSPGVIHVPGTARNAVGSRRRVARRNRDAGRQCGARGIAIL